MRHRLVTPFLIIVSTIVVTPSRAVVAQSSGGAGAAADSAIVASYRSVADSLIGAATRDSAAWRRLSELVDRFGHRLSGSASLESALDWILAEMKKDGLANVRGEPVMVPHWVRGEESAELVTPRRTKLHMLGLGMSVGTPKGGIRAPVVVVSSFDELERRAADVRGKIVLFDVPFTTYRQTVVYRATGPSRAAKLGAKAVLIRSVASNSIRSPHTGALRYDSTVAKIPAAALSVEDAMMLHRMIDRGDTAVVSLKMGARKLPDAPSRNAVAELVGREKPDEVVVLGGHIDSWDVGQGAMDDGGGSVAAWEAVRLMKVLGLRPRRTVRVVLWTNEENGTAGGKAYRDAHAAELGKHVLAMESDGGVFQPRGFEVHAPDAIFATLRQVAALAKPVGIDSIWRTDNVEADVDPIIERGVPGAGLSVDGKRYFWYHHSDGDTVDKLDPAEVARCVAAMAVMAYTVADLPGTELGRGTR